MADRSTVAVAAPIVGGGILLGAGGVQSRRMKTLTESTLARANEIVMEAGVGARALVDETMARLDGELDAVVGRMRDLTDPLNETKLSGMVRELRGTRVRAQAANGQALVSLDQARQLVRDSANTGGVMVQDYAGQLRDLMLGDGLRIKRGYKIAGGAALLGVLLLAVGLSGPWNRMSGQT